MPPCRDPARLSRVVRRLGLSRQKTRPPHRQVDERAEAAFTKGLLRAVKAGAGAHPDKRIELWFGDECHVGLKSRIGHRWWVRGERPRGLRQQGYEWAYLFGAVRSATGQDFALGQPFGMLPTMPGAGSVGPSTSRVLSALVPARSFGR